MKSLKAGPKQPRIIVSVVGPDGRVVRQTRAQTGTQGKYSLKPGETLSVTVKDAKGRTLFRQTDVRSGGRVSIPEYGELVRMSREKPRIEQPSRFDRVRVPREFRRVSARRLLA